MPERQPVARYGCWNDLQTFPPLQVSRGLALPHSWPQVGPQAVTPAGAPVRPQVERPAELQEEPQVKRPAEQQEEPQVKLPAEQQEEPQGQLSTEQQEKPQGQLPVAQQVEPVVLKAGVPWQTANVRLRRRVAWQTSSGTDHAEGLSRMSGRYRKSAENTEHKGDNTPKSFWAVVLTIS